MFLNICKDLHGSSYNYCCWYLFYERYSTNFNFTFLFLLVVKGKGSMIPVGDFQIKFDNATKGGEQVFIRRPNATIKWPGGKGPPQDSPKCGFHGELCIKPEKGGICFHT